MHCVRKDGSAALSLILCNGQMTKVTFVVLYEKTIWVIVSFVDIIYEDDGFENISHELRLSSFVQLKQKRFCFTT